MLAIVAYLAGVCCSAHALPPDRHRVSLRERGDGSYTLTVAKAQAMLWQERVWADSVVAFPRYRRVLYLGPGQRLTVRAYDGTRTHTITRLDGTGITTFDAAGKTAILYLTGPIAGLAFFDIGNWPTIWQSRTVVAINVVAQRRRWRTNVRRFGWLRWMNETACLCVRPDLSRGAVGAVQRRGGYLPCFAEVRRVTDGRLVWRKRLPGNPPKGLSVHSAGDCVTFRFTGESQGGLRFVKPLHGLRIQIPWSCIRVNPDPMAPYVVSGAGGTGRAAASCSSVYAP